MKDGNEEVVGPEEVEAPTVSSDIQHSTSSHNEEEEMEEEIGDEEEVEEDEDLQELRKTLNKNMDKNAAMMIKKHDHKRNKTTREFNIKDNVSVSIPRIDRGGTDLRRLPGKIVNVTKGVNKFYTVLTVWGILNDKYRVLVL